MHAANDTRPKVWLITGAGRGLGFEIARAALLRGDNVVATARDPRAAAQALGEQPNLLVAALDVTDERQAREVAAAAVSRFGRIDVLVNNAGYGLLGAVEETTATQTRDLLATNVEGVLNLLRATLPIMREQGSGHVINVSSLGGFGASAGNGVYGATKFAVEGLSEALAAEAAPLGIKVTIVEPGYFRTGFLSPQSVAQAGQPIADYDQVLDRDLARDADGRQPGDPAKAALAILSVVDADRPPLRLALGADALQRIEQKIQQVQEDVAAWREVSLSTAHSTP